MADKILNARIVQKHDTTANWNKATNFIPRLGELILYTDVNKIKMGNGTTKVTQLPFLSDEDTTDLTQMTGVLELNHGGTGRNLSGISDNCIIRKSNSNDSVPGLYGIVPSSGALYYTGAANAVPQFGILPMAQGGSGTTFASANANAIVRISSNQNQLYYTNVDKGAAYATAADSELSFGNLPLNLGGTGRDFTTSTFANGIVRMPSTISSGESLKAIQTKSGALYATSANGEPEFGILPLAQGGTGRNISSYPGNAIIRMSSDPDTYPYVMYTPTSSGAVYATAENGGIKFGLLPLAQGGTGTAFSSATSGDIVYYYKKDEDSTPQLWTKSKLDIAHGGTNGTTAAEARTNLGVNRIFSGTGAPSSSTGSTGDIYIRYTA